MRRKLQPFVYLSAEEVHDKAQFRPLYLRMCSLSVLLLKSYYLHSITNFTFVLFILKTCTSVHFLTYDLWSILLGTKVLWPKLFLLLCGTVFWGIVWYLWETCTQKVVLQRYCCLFTLYNRTFIAAQTMLYVSETIVFIDSRCRINKMKLASCFFSFLQVNSKVAGFFQYCAFLK